MHSAVINDIRHRLALGHTGVELAWVYRVDAAVISKIKQDRYSEGRDDPESMSDRLERMARMLTRYLGKRRLKRKPK